MTFKNQNEMNFKDDEKMDAQVFELSQSHRQEIFEILTNTFVNPAKPPEVIHFNSNFS